MVKGSPRGQSSYVSLNSAYSTKYADRVMNPPVEHRGILLTSSTWTVPVLSPAPTLTIPLDPGEIPVPYAILLHTRGCGEERFAENAPPMRAQRVNLELNN